MKLTSYQIKKIENLFKATHSSNLSKKQIKLLKLNEIDYFGDYLYETSKDKLNINGLFFLDINSDISNELIITEETISNTYGFTMGIDKFIKLAKILEKK